MVYTVCLYCPYANSMLCIHSEWAHTGVITAYPYYCRSNCSIYNHSSHNNVSNIHNQFSVYHSYLCVPLLPTPISSCCCLHDWNNLVCFSCTGAASFVLKTSVALLLSDVEAQCRPRLITSSRCLCFLVMQFDVCVWISANCRSIFGKYVCWTLIVTIIFVF